MQHFVALYDNNYDTCTTITKTLMLFLLPVQGEIWKYSQILSKHGVRLRLNEELIPVMSGASTETGSLNLLSGAV